MNSKPAGPPLGGLDRVPFASGVAALLSATANSLEKNELGSPDYVKLHFQGR